jgi:hypothetical protein
MIYFGRCDKTSKAVNTLPSNDVNTLKNKAVSTLTSKDVNTLTSKAVNTLKSKDINTFTNKDVNKSIPNSNNRLFSSQMECGKASKTQQELMLFKVHLC